MLLLLDMPLTKVCPQCSAVINIRKSVCVCGHSFNTRKQKSPCERKTTMSVRKAEKRTAAIPTEILARQEQDRACKAAKREFESPAEKLARQERDRACKATKKDFESPSEKLVRQERDRACKATKKDFESPSEKLVRQERDRACKAAKKDFESPAEKLARQERDRACKATKKDFESPSEKLVRQERDRACKAAKKDFESPSEKLVRQERDRACKAAKKDFESPSEKLVRQERDRACKAAKKDFESPAEKLARQERDRACKAAKKDFESPAEKLARQERDKACKAAKKDFESPSEKLARQERNRACKAAKRSSNISTEKVISNFHSLTKFGPEFVCTCCHRMMYKQSVVHCKRSKYTKTSSTVLDQVFSDIYISNDGNQWVCTTCDRALSRGNMPLQAKANGLQLCPVPDELSCLNPLELRLVSLRVPFMKMVALPSGKQRSIHGPAVNVPSKVDTICTVLPRLPSQSELIPLKLKRKLAYRGHYMYDYITPQKVLSALAWLKANNPLYADIEINQEWLEQSMTDDVELFSSLLEPTDTNGPEPMQCETTSTQPEPCAAVSRSTSCQLIIDCGDNMTYTTLEALARDNGFTIHDVPRDGNCMFSALAYQLQCAGICDAHCDSTELRDMVATHLQCYSSLYSHFMSQPVHSHNAYDADTEPPSVEDTLISSITDPELRSELTCELRTLLD